MLSEANENFLSISDSTENMNQRTETFGEKIQQDRQGIGET